MKKLNTVLFILIIVFITLGFSSCERQKYCAQCYENSTGYQASDFCGESDEVDEYIQDFYDAGSAAGQSWSCSKVAE